jgi:hypothetical protein
MYLRTSVGHAFNRGGVQGLAVALKEVVAGC